MIDLITNIDMQAFHTHGGLQSFIGRLDVSFFVCFFFEKIGIFVLKKNMIFLLKYTV